MPVGGGASPAIAPRRTGTITTLSRCCRGLDNEAIEGPMPLIRYFVITGGALLALLYLADYYMAGPVSAAAEAGPDLSIARIHSAQTWAEKIVFDTNVRQIPLTKTVASSTSDAAAPAAPDGTR